MKKCLVLIVFLFLLSGCTQSKNITFTAVIESAFENGVMITTTDDVGFDKASVSFEKNYKPDFELKAAQKVEITILPEIRESYPVQVTAVKIKLLSEGGDAVQYQKITGDAALEMMGGDVIILDTRTKEEYDEGHIQNTILLPYDEIATKADELLPEKDKTILVYCRTGRRSEIAAKELIQMGYTKVYDFGGITTDWKGEVVK